MTTVVSINGSLQINAQCAKSISSGDPTASAPGIAMSLGQFNQSWFSQSSPDGTDAWSGQVTLSGGAATIDLTNLTQANLAGTVDMTGKSLRYAVIVPDSANANSIQIGTGASNGYAALGVVAGLVSTDFFARTTKNASAVDATHKTLDVAGTGTQKLNVLLVFGTP